jgi:hypothetical protein
LHGLRPGIAGTDGSASQESFVTYNVRNIAIAIVMAIAAAAVARSAST